MCVNNLAKVVNWHRVRVEPATSLSPVQHVTVTPPGITIYYRHYQTVQSLNYAQNCQEMQHNEWMTMNEWNDNEFLQQYAKILSVLTHINPKKVDWQNKKVKSTNQRNSRWAKAEQNKVTMKAACINLMAGRGSASGCRTCSHSCSWALGITVHTASTSRALRIVSPLQHACR